jgi:hypothetical protein
MELDGSLIQLPALCSLLYAFYPLLFSSSIPLAPFYGTTSHCYNFAGKGG